MRTSLAAAAAVGLLVSPAMNPARESTPGSPHKRMSFHNRLLLNRAAIAGVAHVEVMIVAADGQFRGASAAVRQSGARLAYSEPSVGYLRADVPIDHLLALVDNPSIEGYQISSLSKAAWYRDTPPRGYAEMLRNYELLPVGGTGTPPSPSTLPPLPIAQAHDVGYTADEEMRLREWFAQHPTFDGRGVTIALLETAQPEFSHPTIGSARSLDGREIPKLAGILNTIDRMEPDDTRVDLNLNVNVRGTWHMIEERIYVFPRSGAFTFGIFRLSAGAGLTHQFGVIRDPSSGEMWVDANGNADFSDEQPIADVNERFDVRVLKLTHPRPMDLAFVAARGRTPDTAHLYVSRGGHVAMTVSVMAGSRTPDGLAYGVAPGARVLLVRSNTMAYRLRDIVEGYIEAAKIPEVDVIASATGFELVPDTSADFAGILFSRIVATFGKPIFQSAGNRQLWLNSAVGLGGAFSVGGSIGPRTYAAFYSGGTLDDMAVHPSSSAGPGIDGALKPDFIAPTHRIAADLWGRNPVPVPKNKPTHQLPPGYQISCCTSASAPYAAGAGALLLSAMKQERLPYSFTAFSRALRTSAQFLPGWNVHQQGNGLLDIHAAWTALKRTVDAPVIRVTAPIAHPLATYSARGSRGEGLFESEGWTAGMRARRTIDLYRETGPSSPVTYRLSWTGNDGTFTGSDLVVLNLRQTQTLPVDITVRSGGVHDAILNLHDPSSNAVVLRVPVTIVAAHRVDPQTHVLRLSGSVPLIRKHAHYIDVRADVDAMLVELEVLTGSATVNILPNHSLFLAYQGQIGPQNGRTFTKGRYTVVIPRPGAGTWTIDINNISTRRERNQALVSADTVDYVITVRLQHVVMTRAAPTSTSTAIDVSNLRAMLKEPVLQWAPATMRTHTAMLPSNGLPHLVEIDVPAETSTLLLEARADAPSTDRLELHLFDCSTGECFSHNYTIPAASRQKIVVRRPSAGRWIAALNAAPLPRAGGRFVLDEIIAGPIQRTSPGARASRATGTRWTETVRIDAPQGASVGASRVILCEIVDAAGERDETEHRWEIRDVFPSLPNSPVAAGALVLQIR